MIRDKKSKRAVINFGVSLLLILILCVISILRVNKYNNTTHYESFSGDTLFSEGYEADNAFSLRAIPRDSTWTKVFDFNNVGLKDHNYRAYTYDFPIRNNTPDEIAYFTFTLHFDKEVFLLSAWNGALKIHQTGEGREYVETVLDLRNFHPLNYSFDTVTFDGETLIRMKGGDYFEYLPSSNENAMEVPLEPFEGTVPGVILYAPIGEEIDGWKVDIEYRFNRLITKDLLFRLSFVGLFLWLIAGISYLVTSAQIRKYKLRHERDNELIHESIETFTGFIDAKDTYTNGHSNRVAEYTKLIAKEMGYSEEELDRIYCIALLHDCGKIGVPDSILKKPGKLDDEEFAVIKSHTVRGGEILKNFKSLKGAEEGALYHHERYDGRGYPEGKAGEDIPLIARMICVADSFDAMNSNRVYRQKLTKETIIEEIEKNKGKQFDPNMADIFLRLIREGKVEIG